MKPRAFLIGVSLAALSTGSVHAFFEEGNDSSIHLGYMKCKREGDLSASAVSGCNPWPDDDANFSYRLRGDMKKSSVHYNMTAALAVAAGFDRCAAYLIGLWDEAVDVATDYDLELWIPLPEGVNPDSCSELLAQEGFDLVEGRDGLGVLVAPDFTYRAVGRPQDNEVNRESHTFHWNLTLSSFTDFATVSCSVGAADPGPVIPNKDMLTLNDLYRWAVGGENPMNQCAYANGINGPIGRYDLNDPGPGSLASLGVFLHALQDSYSHRQCGASDHDFKPGTSNACGFPSGHFAGEFGQLARGGLGSGMVYVKTPASATAYLIKLHSDNTASATIHTYQVLKDYLNARPEYGRIGATSCPEELVGAFAADFAGVPNFVPKAGYMSGAKRRSVMADSLFNSESCVYDAGLRFDPDQLAGFIFPADEH